MSRRSNPSHPSRSRRDVPVAQVLAALERARTVLGEADYATLRSAVDTLSHLTQELAAKGTSIERLRKMLFGASTEKTRDLLDKPQAPDSGGAATSGNGAPEAKASEAKASDDKPKPPGHGRNGADAYHGAAKVRIAHESLTHGDGCPECDKGKVYELSEPATMLRILGVAPLSATCYERDRLRCNLCGEVFTAQAPEGIGEEKYDESAATMVGLLRYGAGVPFNRVEKLQGSLGVPLPASTQWDLVESAAVKMEPVHNELVRQAAQSDLVHNDDTTMRVLELAKAASAQRSEETGEPEKSEPASELAPRAQIKESNESHRPGASREADKAQGKKERKGTFTTGIVARTANHDIALFFTGRNHAGENLQTVLRERAAELPPPIQMCDALSRNVPADFKTILAACLVHGRRTFVDVFDAFPKECEFVLEELARIFKHDAEAKKAGLSPAARLQYHQEHSQSVMDDLQQWMVAQMEGRKVEPNSGLGEAIAYMRRHWKELTLFLRVPGAPLDNNICERALKKAILHRKNSYFFKTLNGALVGDRFMTLIHTCELNCINPFVYLIALQKHHKTVARNPSEWLPWNYTAALTRIVSPPAPPPP